MPPKPKGEDKTFGMKNKKGGKAQKYMQTVQKMSAGSGKNKEDLAKERDSAAKLEQKKALEAKKKLDAELFKTVQTQQKVPFGTDPKSVLCIYFKGGHCEKGNKCKFSHDKNVERKVEKVNIYEDARKDDKKTDLMETWNEEKLRDVVEQNAKGQGQRTETDIVCKYFIQAIEEKKYGWFWECPNGGDKCMYRHALPPGFVLKADKKAAEEAAKKDKISLEEFLEVERHRLKPPLTPVTEESFAIWKKTRQEKKAAEADAMEKAKQSQRAAGKMTGMTGKDMFEFGGELYGDDEEAEEDDWDISRLLAQYREEQKENEEGERQDDANAQDQADVEAVEQGVGEIEVK